MNQEQLTPHHNVVCNPVYMRESFHAYQRFKFTWLNEIGLKDGF